jgi:type IV secretion system protein VirD4
VKTIATMLGALLFCASGLAALTLKFSPNSWADTVFRYGARQEWILFAPWWQAAIVAVVGLALLLWGTQGEGWGKKKLSESDSHGSARLSLTKEICPRPDSRRHGVVLCMESEADVRGYPNSDGTVTWQVLKERPFICALKEHVLVEGYTGSGKDVSVAIPTLLTDVARSYVILDPKGETYRLTAGYRNRYQRVVRFAPCSDDSAGFNPLLEVQIGTRHAVKSAKRIANVLVGSTAKEEMSSRIYLKSCETLLTAAILYVMHHGKGADRSLPGVLRLLIDPGAREQKDIARRIAEDPPPGCSSVMNSLKILAQDGRMLQGAFTTALDVLDFCTMEDVAEAISRSDFRPSDLANGQNPLTVYLEFPFDDADILRPLARLMLNVLIGSHRKARKRDTCYLLNELPSLGCIPALLRGIGEAREFGVQFVVFVQSIGQLENDNAYGRSGARTIMDNCPVKLTLGAAGQQSAEDASAELGKATIVRERITKAVSKRSLLEQTVTQTRGEGEQARELMTPDEVHAMETVKVLLRMPAMRSYIGKRAVSYSQPELVRRMKVPPPSSRRLKLAEVADAS